MEINGGMENDRGPAGDGDLGIGRSTETDGCLAVRVRTENGQAHTRISAERLVELVHRIGGADDHFLVVQRIPDRPGLFIQVAHEPRGVYEFQHRTGSVPHMWVTEVTDPGLVADVMVRWARQERDWDAGVTWRRDELAPPEEVPAPDPRAAGRAEQYVRELLQDGYLGIDELVRETVYLMEDALSPPRPAGSSSGCGWSVSTRRRPGRRRPARTGWSGRSRLWSAPASSPGRTSPAAMAAA